MNPTIAKTSLDVALDKAVDRAVAKRYKKAVRAYQDDPYNNPHPADWEPDPEKISEDIWDDQQFVAAHDAYVKAYARMAKDAVAREVDLELKEELLAREAV